MPRTLPAVEEHQQKLLARANVSANAAELGVRRVWLDLLRVVREGGPWLHVYRRAGHVLRSLPAVAHDVARDLTKAHRDAARWGAEKLAATLPRTARLKLLRRRGLLEDVAAETDLLVGMLLPPLDEAAVARVVYGSGWWHTFARLTALAAPDELAARIAGGVQQGLSVAKIAAQIRPLVQDVQTVARRVARTASLLVAHEAELDVYRQLEGDLIVGYQINAVLDARTRPAHRARNGQQFFCKPAAGQRGLADMPHPPRESDGSLSFNCRCWCSPILAAG